MRVERRNDVGKFVMLDPRVMTLHRGLEHVAGANVGYRVAFAVPVADCPASIDGMKVNEDVLEGEFGGGGGSRTRVRNRCQPGESMLSPVPIDSPLTLRTDKMRQKLVR